MRLAILLLLALPLQATNLITNGTFETGTLTGWTATTNPFANTTGSCNSPFAAQASATGCVTGVNPVSGTYAAYSSTSFPLIPNSVGQYSNYLSQTILIPNNIASAFLTWSDAAVWSGAGNFRGIVIGVEIYLGNNFLSNQISLSNPGISGQFNWSNHVWNVTSILQNYAGNQLTFRLASIAFFDTRGSFYSAGTALNTAFDNISLDVVVPEPATYATAATALLALGLTLQRRRPR